MPDIFITKNYYKVQAAKDAGFTTCSLQGSSRSSKTYSIIQLLCVWCHERAKTTVSIIRAGMPSIKRTVYRDFRDVMISFGWWDERNMNKSDFIYYFDNGSWIEFFSTDNEQKVRGSKRKILFVNEANELSFIEWQQLQMRTTEFSILDYNPSFSEEHWINLVNQEKSTYFFISTYKDNPFLEPKVVAEIESLQWKNKSLWQVYGLGQRAVVEGLVFPHYTLVDAIPYEAKKHRCIGMDFGYSSDPTAIVEVAFWGKKLYVDEHCYRTHMLATDIIAELKRFDWCPEIISESADPRLIDEIYNAGLDIKPVHKTPGSINAGLTKMQEYEICITRRSTNIIKEFKNYTYRQDKEGKWLNEPIDCYNHCFVADTMVNTIDGKKRIVDIKIGDFVYTSNGLHPVTNLFIQGCREVWRVSFDFGNFAIEIEATPDHRIKTNRGWKQLKDIQEQDVLYILKSEIEEGQILKAKNSMVKYITDTEARDIFPVEHIDSIESYGSSTMAKYQRDVISIIKTKIPPIMLSKILNSCKAEAICHCILRSASKMRLNLQECARIWQRLVNMPKNGIIQKKVADGTPNIQGSNVKKENQEFSSAIAAERNLSQKTSESEATISAQITVSQNTEEICTSTMKQESVLAVGKSLLSTSIQDRNTAVGYAVRGIKIKSKGIKPTYDIEVAGQHEFFANGVLVHNCIDSVRYVILEKILGAYSHAYSASQLLFGEED